MNIKSMTTPKCLRDASLRKACAESRRHLRTDEDHSFAHTCGELVETFEVVEIPNDIKEYTYTTNIELRLLSKSEKSKAKKINKMFHSLDTGERDDDDKRIYYYALRSEFKYNDTLRTFKLVPTV